MSRAEDEGLIDDGAPLERSPAGDFRSRAVLALLVLAGVLALDVATKLWVVQNMVLHESISVFGDFVRLTYTHNPGAAFGINIGEHSRLFFLVLSILALGVLTMIYRATPTSDRLRLFAVALVGAGAIGNILDRLRYERGVVDFLDVGIGAHRWWVFNVADSAVTVGAVLLLISYLLEERRERASGRAETSAGGPELGVREPEA
ncbi:MAG: signal peptidase II [Gemmatimonadota bacterium]